MGESSSFVVVQREVGQIRVTLWRRVGSYS